MNVDREGVALDADSLWRQQSVPENQAPVSVAFDVVLARTEDVAVFVSGLHVYPNGVRFTIEVRTRRVLFGPGATESVLHDNGPTALLVGVELADGQRCVHDRYGRLDRSGAVLRGQRGGGSSREASLDLFLSPLPPAGVNKLLCAWPGLGIADQVSLLPTQDIRAAAENAIELWPWEPEIPRPDREPPRPGIPAGSWFSPSASARRA
jgi:hypothetical protein